MKKLPAFLTAGVACVLWASSAAAYMINVYSIDGPQDPLNVHGRVDEIGLLTVFPAGEQISSSWTVTNETACWDGSDNPGILNVLVTITNVDVQGSPPLWYVADLGTIITNFDGWIGNTGLGTAEEAFRIDSVGINRPLLAESGPVNNRFDPGETWTFIIQDFFNVMGGPPAPFDSLGIASASGGWPPSTGSIITPEPATLALVTVGGLAVLWRRRK